MQEIERTHFIEFEERGKSLKQRKIKLIRGKKNDDLICSDTSPEVGSIQGQSAPLNVEMQGAL